MTLQNKVFLMREGGMNCDQAFDFLTDSSRRDSETLARHLASCARCRQLKETLAELLIENHMLKKAQHREV